MNQSKNSLVGVLLLLLLALPCLSLADDKADFAQWGKEALARTQMEYLRPDGLYADEITADKGRSQQVAFMWGCGVQVTALAAAAQMDRATYLPPLRRFLAAMEVYWIEYNGLYGYNVLPQPSPPDRFYDDNVWMVLAFIEMYELTRERPYLDRAESAFRFVLSGEDAKLDGGIYWHESERNLKGTDPNGAASVAALRLYKLTRKAAYLNAAKRLYAWTNTKLQDKDGLFFDAYETNGKLHPAKWTYNTAMMLRSNCLFYATTGEKKYLDEAQRLAAAAEKQWIRPETGGVNDYGAFAHMLTEAFLFLYDQDKNQHWLDVTRHALTYLHEHVRDAAGYYGRDWATPVTAQQNKVPLLHEASAARAFWMAARYP